jgi:hypothetical protein
MVRALTTLAGLAAAAAILYFVTDVGTTGGRLWPVALVWAGAGLALGVLYQGGGRRAPGLRMNLPLLIVGFLPWTILTAALVAIQADKPVWLADRGRDLIPDAWIGRWEFSLPVFAFGSGLLLAFSLIEPRIGIREPDAPNSTNAPIEEYTPYTPPEPAPDVPITAVQPSVRPEAPTVVEPQAAIDERPTALLLSDGAADDGDAPADENPVQVIHPQREGQTDG